jgi:arabinogalactan oligomer / maltooligosaccharide transport system substrate-binding protein
MNLKKRLFIILILISFLALEFYIADRSAIAQANEEHGIIPAKDTLYLWYTDEDLTDYLNSTALSYYEETDIRIVPVLKSGLEYIEEINDASIYQEKKPDLFIISNDSLEKVYLAGLSSTVTDPYHVLTQNYYPSTALNAVTYQNKMVAYPFYFETSIFVYNKTYLEDAAKAAILTEQETADDTSSQTGETEITEDTSTSDTATSEEASLDTTDPTTEALVQDKMESMVPATIDDILTLAKNYDAPDNVEGVFKWDVSDIFYNYFVVGNYISVGGETGDDSANVDIYNLNTIDCLHVYQNLNQFFSIDSDAITYDSVVQDFLDGKIVMTVATTDIISKIEEAKAAGTFPYDYCVTTIPNITQILVSRGLSVTNAVAVNGYCDNKTAANDFAQYLTYENSDSLYSRTGKIASKSCVQYENSQVNACIDEYAKSIPMPKMRTTSNFWVALEISFSQIWNGADVNTTLKSLSEQIMTQITGEPYTEELIVEPVDDTVIVDN